MYAGRVIETGPVSDIFHRARHHYTKALLESIPKRGRKESGKKLPTIEGIVPSLFNLPEGCRFAARCGRCEQHCIDVEPDLVTAADGRAVRCHFPIGEEKGGADGAG